MTSFSRAYQPEQTVYVRTYYSMGDAHHPTQRQQSKLWNHKGHRRHINEAPRPSSADMGEDRRTPGDGTDARQKCPKLVAAAAGATSESRHASHNRKGIKKVKKQGLQSSTSVTRNPAGLVPSTAVLPGIRCLVTDLNQCL